MTHGDSAKWATAYHEAGHCVAGLVLGADPTTASIVAGDNFEGYTRFEDEDVAALLVSDPPRDAAERYIIRSFAGAAAEQRYTGDDATLGACEDYAQAGELLIRLTAEHDRPNADLVARTNSLLDEHWPAIEGVAAALVKHLTVDGDAIRRAARAKGRRD